ncbi:MAG: hypothetical protein ACOC90_11585 [Bacteroidota bacterium]
MGEYQGDVQFQSQSQANVSYLTKTIGLVAVCFSLFHVYTAIFGLFGYVIQRGVHLAFAVTLITLQRPLGQSIAQRRSSLFLSKTFLLLDIIIIILMWASVYVANWQYMMRLQGTGQYSVYAIIAGAVLLLVVLETSSYISHIEKNIFLQPTRKLNISIKYL